MIFCISAWTHLQGWLTGSGPSALDWDLGADGQAGTLGLVPPVGVEVHWGLPLGDRQWGICRPSYSGGRSVGLFDGLFLGQEKSHS